ncbi:unnamed protein product [Brugia pahangi]|uniref:Pkinase_Tyr domain-containing protein n=1 Tax=Brugia pahangi TaxID=6280 RepID=A0A0N4T5J5_BRUPA|nr:unnamed protein product [Brugia pahangi]
MSFVKNGGRPEKPQFCPDEMWAHFLNCFITFIYCSQTISCSFTIVERAWVYDPEERPRFADLLPELEALRGCPLYQEDIPYPPNCSSLRTDSNFEFSFNSNISRGESGHSGSIRFDKSDNPSAKKQGRPSILRSLRRERSRPLSNLADLEAGNRSRSVNSVTNDMNSSTRSQVIATKDMTIAFSYRIAVTVPKKSHSKKSQLNRSKQRASELSNRSPVSSSSSPLSSPRTPSSGNSDIPSMYIRPARVSRV